jgi:large subunit ribosomal protein L18
MNKKDSRIRRSVKSRAKIKSLKVHRLCVHKTPKHIYAQVLAPEGGVVIASASTVEKDLRSSLSHGGNKDAASQIGKLIAERTKENGVETVAFDRSGFKYHGRVKALADAARDSGLKF